MDKNQCVSTCEKIAAYRDGRPWEEIGLRNAAPIEKETVIMEEAKIKDKKPAKKDKRDIVTLDFSRYPDLKAVIFECVDNFLLPPDHIIFSMLAGAIPKSKRIRFKA